MLTGALLRKGFLDVSVADSAHAQVLEYRATLLTVRHQVLPASKARNAKQTGIAQETFLKWHFPEIRWGLNGPILFRATVTTTGFGPAVPL